ncbi:MAG: hypothetical protein HKN85_12540 [Gammaproteobacteria bacterium]|nr:hypothetical protein [Gammaproteobacteria bacterium]
MSSKINRRGFLALGGVTMLGVSAYSYQRGIRIPPLIWEPPATSAYFSLDMLDISVSDLIRVQQGQVEDVAISFRAYAPEPALQLRAKTRGSLRLSANNIPVDAVLQLNGIDANSGNPQVSESINGITRILEVTFDGSDTIELSWKLTPLQTWRFAAIGDSGGGAELGWCIQRAHALGARFLVHLGDFNYQPGDYASAIILFNEAPMPC